MNDKNFSLSHQVFKKLEEEILREKIPTGEVLTELGLSAEYGVSRTPIREAVTMLEQEGLVDNTGKKIIVLGFTKKDMLDIMDVRIALEGMAFGKTAECISEDGIKELEDILKLQAFYISEGDSENINKMDSEFHYCVYKHCGSAVYCRILTEMHRKIQRFRVLSVKSEPKARKSGNEHAEIFEAIKNHDSKLAQRLATEHTLNAKKRMIGE